MIKFVPPEEYRDLQNACIGTLGLITDGLKIASPGAGPLDFLSFAPAAYKNLRSIALSLKKKETDSIENIAWRWLLLTLTDATSKFLMELRSDTEIVFSEKEKAVERFLKSSMEVPSQASFDISSINDIRNNLAFAGARRRVPELITSVTRLVVFDTQRYLDIFDNCLAISAPSVFGTNYSEFEGLIEAVAGPTAQLAGREAAWMRHYQWIQDKFYTKPVFSPDGSVTTPLSELYLKPRYYSHTKIPPKTRNDGVLESSGWSVSAGYLHDEIANWLTTTGSDRVRVVSGGPGSGKSSFALALAAQTSLSNKARVLFIELQRFNFVDRLTSDIGTYLVERDGTKNTVGSPGFPENPILWIKNDPRPHLIIFDGLDELTHDDAEAKKKSRDFILKVKQFVDDLRNDGAHVKAVILGRSVACQDGIRAAALPPSVLMHVAPIRELINEDFNVNLWGQNLDGGRELEIPVLSDEFMADKRPEYWRKWSSSQGLENSDIPEAITHKNLESLNVEPLLLHLLILSDFCGERWKEASSNRNLVYDDILCKIHSRNAGKRNAAPNYGLDDFMLLMECLGIAAWRGNGRAGDEQKFNDVRDHHASHRMKALRDLASTDMDSVVLQTHARRVEGSVPGFEFIHKTFGEYLAARGVISLAVKTSKRLSSEDDPASESSVALHWTNVVKDAELTSEINRFIIDEARRRFDSATATGLRSDLNSLLGWVRQNGMPANRVGDMTYRQMEKVQSCSELSVIAAAAAISGVIREKGELEDDQAFRIRIASQEGEVLQTLTRIGATSRIPPSLVLHDLDFRGSYMLGVNLISSDLSFSDLSLTQLDGAQLTSATMVGAIFNNARLINTDLSNSDLFSSDFTFSLLDGATFEGSSIADSIFTYARGRRVNFDSSLLTASTFDGCRFIEGSFASSFVRGVSWNEANLIYCDLSHIDFEGCDFSGCSMSGSYLGYSDLSEALNITQEMINETFGIASENGRTLLPSDIQVPAHWFVGDEMSSDEENEKARDKAFSRWRAESAYKVSIRSQPGWDEDILFETAE